MSGVGVEEAAAVGAEHLDRLLGGDRAHRDRLCEAGDRVHDQVVGEIGDHALGGEHDRGDHRQRREHIQDRAHQVLPEVADSLATAPDYPPDQRDRHDDPDACRQPVLHCEPNHLAEVGHRGLAAVELPVGVRHERRDGVERDVPRRRVVAERVQQMGNPRGVLRAQHEIQEQPAHEREHDQALGVCLPVLLVRGIDVQDFVEKPLGDGEYR